MKAKTHYLMAGLVISLSACSQHSQMKNEMNELETDFNNHKPSSYVNSNIISRSVDTQEQSGLHTLSTKHQVKLKKIKHQLENRKQQASSKLGNTILNNDLHTPSNILYQKISALGGQYEYWLSNNSNLQAVLAIALKNNLDIKSSLQQAQASLAKYDQVSFLDDMLSQYATFTKDLRLSGSTQKHNKPVSNIFPFPGILALKASIIDQAVETSRLELKQTVQDVITQTLIAYYELRFTQNEIDILITNNKLLTTLKQELENSYSTNSTELSGVIKAEIEIAKNKDKLQIAQEKKKALQANLNNLLNLSPTFTLGKLDKLKSVKLDLSSKQKTKELLEFGRKHRIEIIRLQSELKKMERIIHLSEKRFYPDFSAGYSRFQSRGSKSGFLNTANIKNKNFFATNDAFLSETRLKYKALKSRIEALKTKTEDDIQQALSKVKTQKQTNALYKNKILPKAKASLDIAKNRYETGDTSYLEVIKAEQMILNYKLLSLKALKDSNVNAARILRLLSKSNFN